VARVQTITSCPKIVRGLCLGDSIGDAQHGTPTLMMTAGVDVVIGALIVKMRCHSHDIYILDEVVPQDAGDLTSEAALTNLQVPDRTECHPAPNSILFSHYFYFRQLTNFIAQRP